MTTQSKKTKAAPAKTTAAAKPKAPQTTAPDTSPAAALKANIAAARDLPRQLRLRGLGGQVVVDFAPVPKKDRGTLDQVMKAAFRAEGGESHLAGWTALGLYEMTRKRDRLPLAALLEAEA